MQQVDPSSLPKEDQMRREFADERLGFFVGDVRDRASVDEAMVGMRDVFHAAALKQVPSSSTIST